MEVAQFGNTELKVTELKSAVEKLRQRENGKDRCKMEDDFEVCLYCISHILQTKDYQHTKVVSCHHAYIFCLGMQYNY